MPSGSNNNRGNDFLEQTKRLIGVETAPKTWYEEMEEELCQCSCCPDLSWQQRLYGCFFCFLIGFCLEVGSFFRFMQLIGGNPQPSAYMYTIGNLVAISGTCFLSGPKSQMRKMCHNVRRVSTILFFLSMILTLVVAIGGQSLLAMGQGLQTTVLIILIVVQFLCLVWYTLSYIPFAQDLVKNCCKGYCCPQDGV